MTELGPFLRHHHDRLRPSDVGLEPGPRRRVPGLRREEVALLAGLSVPYYALLEQGGDARPSPEVLDALAGALRLSAPEHALLYRLALAAPPPPSTPETAQPGLVDLVDRL